MPYPCPLTRGRDSCEQCPYWPQCEQALEESWNSFPERRAPLIEDVWLPGDDGT